MRLPTRIEERGRTTDLSYDSAGNLTSERITDSASGAVRSASWTNSRLGLPESFTDAAGRRWSYEYDSLGNRTAVTDPVGGTTRFTHDYAGRVLTQSSPGRAPVQFTYDLRGRLLTSTAGSLTTTYSYTPIGQLASVTRARWVSGRTTRTTVPSAW